MADLVETMRMLLPSVEGKPREMLALARQLRNAGDPGLAQDLALRARALGGEDAELRVLANDVLSEGVPHWHFVIVRDRDRNQAYEAALRRAIFPGARVLEIGTGTGLLAMIAARAGAEVVTCEADPAVAAAARDVIAANGLIERIRVVNKHSTALDLQEDLGGFADILVSEIVSNDLLSEGVLPAHRDAVARLLKPGAQVIPARGHLRVALAEDTRSQRRAMTSASGFDLSAFNRLAKPYLEVAAERPGLTLRSEPSTLFSFDFARGPWGHGSGHRELVSSGGTVNGVVSWIALDLDDAARYDNRPGGEPSCWSPIFWPATHRLDTAHGQPVRVGGRYEEARCWFWLDVGGSGAGA